MSSKILKRIQEKKSTSGADFALELQKEKKRDILHKILSDGLFFSYNSVLRLSIIISMEGNLGRRRNAGNRIPIPEAGEEEQKVEIVMRPIAHIRSDFEQKFGIPRQSGLVEELEADIVMEEEFRNPDAFRGIEGFSHLWLIWQFSENVRTTWNPTVRPPRLGGNTRLGVFATRSPFRPNAIGLSCVRLAGFDPEGPEGPVLHVTGADLMDGTPILDIKPYHPGADAHPEASAGFTSLHEDYRVRVDCPEELLMLVPEEKRRALLGVLSEDPRPAFHTDPERIYGMRFAGLDVHFRVDEDGLHVVGIHAAQQ